MKLKFWELAKVGAEDVMRHKLRSALTMLGVVFGVGSVVAMLAVGEGASRQAVEAIKKLGSLNVIVSSVKPPQTGMEGMQRSQRMTSYGLFYDDETRINETIPGVMRTVPAHFTQKRGSLCGVQQELRIVATTPDWFEIVERPLLAGRVISERDNATCATVAVLTEVGARKLLAARNTIGQTMRIDGVTVEIIGIVQSFSDGGSMQTPDRDTDVYLPMRTARERFGKVDFQRTASSYSMESVELSQIIVQFDEVTSVEPGVLAIEAMLRAFHKSPDYRLDVPLALLREAEATKRRFNGVLGSIAAISLLVGGIGIMNIMLASVTERTQEIGIRRAIGAKRSHIVTQFLIETCVLSVGGGVIGLALGVGIPLIITRVTAMPTDIRPYSLFLAFSISVAIGIIFGLYPARRAANLDPVVALRRE